MIKIKVHHLTAIEKTHYGFRYSKKFNLRAELLELLEKIDFCQC